MRDLPGGAGPVVHEFGVAPGLSVSFQRYPLTGSAVLSEQPRSWGALPVAVAGPGRLLLPLPDGEGFWLGLVPERHGQPWSVRVIALLSPQGATDALSGVAVGEASVAAALTVPPHGGLPGVGRADGTWWALTRIPPDPGAPSCRQLTVVARPGGDPAGGPSSEVALRIDLVGPADFEELSGSAVPPLRPDAPYGGRRLP